MGHRGDDQPRLPNRGLRRSRWPGTGRDRRRPTEGPARLARTPYVRPVHAEIWISPHDTPGSPRVRPPRVPRGDAEYAIANVLLHCRRMGDRSGLARLEVQKERSNSAFFASNSSDEMMPSSLSAAN